MADSRPARSVAGIFFILLAMSLVALMVTITVAQEPRVGILEGRVINHRGEPVPGAFVTVPTVIENETRRVRADENGLWRAAAVPVGQHTVYAQRRGFYTGNRATGTLEEGQTLQVDDIVLHPAQEYINIGVMYPQSVMPGSKKDLYISGLWGEEKAQVSFSIYAYDMVADRIAYSSDEDVWGYRESTVDRLDENAEAIWTWERTYTTDEMEGYFSGQPSTPVLDKPGTYIVVARLGDLQSSDTLNVTEIALVVKQDPESLLAWTTGIKDGNPLEGVDLQIYSGGQQLASLKSNQNGLASAPISHQQSVVIARWNDSVAITNTYFYESDYGEDSLIYTDRPIYRPGHTVHFKGIFRTRQDNKYTALSNRSLEFIIEDPEGQRVASIPAVTNAIGSAAGSWTSDQNSRFGGYRIRVEIDGKTYDRRFSVEEYRKPEFQVTVNVPESIYIKGDRVQASIRANYFFGAPVPNAEVTYTVYRSYWYYWEYESEYESWFDSEYGGYGYDYGGYGELVQEGRGRTDENGELVIDLDTRTEESQARWVIDARVVDVSMREERGTGGFMVAPADYHIQATTDRYLYKPGQTVSIDLHTTNWQQSPVQASRIDVVISEEVWKDGKHSQSQVHQDSTSTGADGKGIFTWVPDKKGFYRITFTGRDAKGRQTTGETSVWISDEQYDGDRFGPDETLSIIADKKLYQPGDTARLLVQAQPGSTLLYTVESDRLISSQVLQTSSGAVTVELPLTDAHKSGVDVSIAFIKNGAYRVKNTRIAVAPDSSFLDVQVTSNKPRYNPGEMTTYTIRTLDHQGRGVSAEVSLGVVDESIYALREDNTPDMRRFFWGPRRSKVSTYTSIEDYYYGGLDKFDDDIRKEFPDTAYWNPFIRTDAQGRATVSFRMPDSLTTWRATARAVSLDTKVGSATHKCLVTKDLIVRLQAPRFFRERDKQTLGVIVHNYTDENKRVNISLSAQGLSIDGRDSHQVQVRANGIARVTFSTNADSIGTATLIARAVTTDRAASDAVQREIPVHAHGALERDAKSGSLTDYENRDTERTSSFVTLDDEGRLDTASMTVSITPSTAGAVFEGLEYLAGYPWGCVEQTISSFVPNILVKRVMDDLGRPMPKVAQELPKMISKGVTRLQNMQNYDGSWGWFGEDYGNLEMTSYAVFALAEARKAGVEIPQDMIDKAAEWIVGRLSDPLLARPSEKNIDAYRADMEKRAQSVLAAAYAGKPSRSAYDQLWQRRDDLSVFAVACLGLSAASAGWTQDVEQVARLLESRARTSNGLTWWTSNTEHSHHGEFTSTALSLQVLTRAGRPISQLDRIARFLVINRAGGYWNSTQETAFVVFALVEHQERVIPVPCEAEVEINGQRIGSVSFTEDDFYKEPKVLNVPREILKRGRNDIAVVRTGKAPIFWSAVLQFRNAGEDLPARPGHFTVERRFTRVTLSRDNRGTLVTKEDPIRGRVPVGQTIRMHLTIRGTGSYIVAECPLPSGFEVIQTENEYYYDDAGRQIHDDRLGLFFGTILSERTITVDLRPEIAGDLHIMPVDVYSMYQPDLFGRSAEDRITVR